jgi:hypothetical protein
MEKVHYLLTKAGPRLLNLMVDANQVDIIVTAPGMLCQRLEFVTNLGALDGCDAGFYTELSRHLYAHAYCGHTTPKQVDISVNTHRLGAELSIDLGEPNMYQSLLRLRTCSGRSFREVIQNSRSLPSQTEMMAGLYVVKAEGHHEHYQAMPKAQENKQSHQHHNMKEGA